MVLESLDTAVEQFFFWAGIVFALISAFYLIVCRPNKKGVFQTLFGGYSLQSDKSVGYAMLGVMVSTISITTTFGYVIWGIIASIGFPIFMGVIHNAYWRAFNKAVVAKIKDFFNKIEAIFKGKNRKE